MSDNINKKIDAPAYSKEHIYDLAVNSISISLCIICIMFAVLSGLDLFPYGEPIDFALLAILAVTGPIGFYGSFKAKRIEKIEERLPDFLRDVAESGRFGMTLAKAISRAALGKYGALTSEIQKMAAQIDWGVSATKALRLFAARVNTPLINRCVSIIVKASEAGGDVADVLTAVSNDAKESQMLLKERRIQMSIYVAIVYVAFFVFMATILIMNFVFLPEMLRAGAPQASGGAVSSTMIQTSSIRGIQDIYLYALVIHAIGDGILAGVIDTGKISNGLRHSFIMVFVAYILFRVIL
ncbi:MAG: type II secretion system F family protein [Thermoplasmata archaeon]